MESNIIYHEKFTVRGFIAILGPIAALMFIMLMYHLIIEPAEPFLSWTVFYLTVFIIFFILAYGFSTFSIALTDESITVGFKIKKSRIFLDNVSDIHFDEFSALRYGGFGIRVAKVKGKLTLVYNTLGTPRCVLTLSEGRFSKFVFSTKNPEEVIDLVRAQLRSIK